MMKIAKTAAAIITILVAIAVLQHSTGWAEGNNAPVMATPSSTSLEYLFPRGTATALSFPSDPATDTDGDTVTYRFVFTVPDTSTVGDTTDTTEVEPSDALFSVSQSGNRFEFEGKTGTTPHQFNALYGDTATYSVPVKMYANDGTDDSAPLSFTIAAVYDASARFPSPATYQSDNRWAVSSTYETYEGPNAAGNIAITWHASEHSSNRAWSPGLAVASAAYCWDGTGRISTAVSSLWPGPYHNPPAQNGADDELFSVTSLEDTSAAHPTGTVAVVFRNEEQNLEDPDSITRQFPDFENPHDADADNVYHLRIVNDHEITYPEPDYGELGCSGSAVDISIQVKDVGPPAPVEDLTSTLERTNKFTVNWNKDTFNRFIEGDSAVNFPHESFNAHTIHISHSPHGLVFPNDNTSNPRLIPTRISGIDHISGTPGTTYTLTVQLENSEGLSDPVTTTITIPEPSDIPDKPTVSAAGPTSLNVVWDVPNNNGLEITGYSLRFRKQNTLSWIYWYENKDTGTTDTITTLEPNTTYQVQVRAHRSNVGSEWSQTATAKTDQYNATISHLFPRGNPTKLEFSGPIAGDPDGTGATYGFTFARPGQEESLTPAGTLLSVEGPDEEHDFTITAAAGTTPGEFRTLYGADSHSITVTGTLVAVNTLGMTSNMDFDLKLTYDDSPQLGDPAEYQSNNRWSVTDPYQIYEGSASLPALSIPWTAFSDGHRNWSAGTPTGVTFTCTDHDEVRPAGWPDDGEKDSEFFKITPEAAADSGTVTAMFKTAPDYENPRDNTYHLRVTTDHNLHDLGTESDRIGCDGSSVDVLVEVKDVGTPTPVTPTGSFSETDPSKVNISWDAPTQFIEDGAAVDFPHSAFNPSAYDYRHRPTYSDSWTEVTGVTQTTATITGLTGETLQVQVRATNSEGTSPWPDTFITITKLPQVSISAVASPITEGNNAQFQVTLHRSSSLTVNLTYSWLGGHGSATGGTVTFSDSNSQALSLPTTSTGTAGSITVTVVSGTGYTIGSPSSATVTINRQTTPPSTPAAPSLTPLSSTAIRATWQEPASQPPITSYTVRYSVADANDWTETAAATTTADITGLTVNTSYDVEVKAHNPDGASSWSSTATASTKTLTATITSDQASVTEGNPASFTVTLSREETVTVALDYSWSGSHGTDTNGTLTFSASDSETLSVPTTATGATGSLTVTIASSTAYTTGSPSSSAVTINRRTTPPSTPAAPSLTPLSSTSIRASWQPPTSQKPITSYTLHHSVADADDWTEITATGTTTAEITGLKVGTSYDVQVKAHNSDGASGFSPSATASTLTLSATIASDQTSVVEGNAASFTVSLSRTETVTVDLQYTWTESHGTATKGSISFTASDSETISIPTTATGATGTLTVAVSSKDAYTVGTPSSASVTINRQTTPPSTPAAPSLTPLSSTAIRGTWQEPASQKPITSYTLAYSVADKNDWTEQTITSTTADITGLTVNTAYDVEVKAHNSDGDSNWSPRSTASTLTLTATITSDQPSITEGNAASFTISLSRTETVTVALEYAWSGSHGTATGNTVSFSASESETISIPTTATGTNGSLTVTIGPSNAYTIGSSNTATVTIDRQTMPPATPDAPSLTPLSSTSIRASWQAPSSQSPITSYTLAYSLADANDWTELTITGTTADVTGLTVNTAYDVEVKAHNSDGSSSWSTAATASTKTLTVTITSDQSSVTEGNAASFTVSLSREETVTVRMRYSWTGPHGTATGDTLAFSTSDSETISIPTIAADADGSLTVTIASSTAYTIGSPSLATVTINRQATPPSTPTAPSLTPLSSTSVRASWQTQTSQEAVTSYTLAYSVADANDWTEITSTGTSADITGLKVNTAYDFQLKAHNSDGASSWSATATTSTLTLIATISSDQTSITEGNPARFTVSLSREESVAVTLQYTWTESHGSTTRHTVTFSSSDSQTISIPTTATGTDGNLTVAISPSNAYTIGTPSSESVTINRLISPPSRPAPPSLTPLSSISIRATWQTPTSQQPLTSYTLRYRVTGTEPWTEELKTGTTANIAGLTVNTGYDVQVQAHSTGGASEWSRTSTDSTRDLTVRITADQTSVTEGETAHFTITLSTQAPVQVNVQYTWNGDFGSTGAQQVQILNAATYDISVPTRISTSQSGSVTASVSPSNAYRVAGTDATVNINKIKAPEPTTPTPEPTVLTPEPTDDSAGETPEPTDPPKTTTEPTTAPPTAAPPTPAPPTAAPPTAAPPTSAPPTSEPTQGPPKPTDQPEEAGSQSGENNPTKAPPTPTPIPQPTATYKPEPTLRPTVVITSIFDDPTPVPVAMTTTTMVSVPPRPPASPDELNPPADDEESGHILRTPKRWVTTQVQHLPPATRDAIKAIIVLPRQRLTLIAVLAVALVAAAGVFTYLISRRQ